MNFKKLMLVTFVLLAIVTIGAVSASDDATANGNLTASDIVEVPIAEASDDVIAEVPVGEASGDNLTAEVSIGEASGDNLTAENPQPTVGFVAGDFNVWINNKTLDFDKDLDEVAISFTSPEGANGYFEIYVDGFYRDSMMFNNQTAGKTFNVTFDELTISDPGNHTIKCSYNDDEYIFEGTLKVIRTYSRDKFDTEIFENVGSTSYRLYYLYFAPTTGTFIVYVNGEKRYSRFIDNQNPYLPIYVGDLNITYNDKFNITTEYFINSSGQLIALDTFICNVYCMPVSVAIEDAPVRISSKYDSVGYVGDKDYIDGTVLVFVDGAQIYSKEFSASDEIDFYTLEMDELKLLDNITHGNHAIKIVYKKNGDADYSKEALVFFQASAKISCPSTINLGEDKYITVTYLEGTTGKVTVKLGIKEQWGDGPYDFDFYEGSLLMTVDVVNGVAKIPLKTLPAGYQGLFLDVEIGNYTTNKLVRIDVVESAVATKIIVASKVTTTYGTSKKVAFTLKDAKNNVLASKKVTIVLNGKTYKGTTDKNGVAYVTIPNNLVVKSYFATISFAGDSQYKKSSAKITVTVSKANPKLTAAAKAFKRTDKTKSYIVTLKTDKNAVYKNAKVTVTVNKVTYSAKTNAKGQATFKLTKLTKNGKYSALVKFAGDTKYKASNKSVKITVK